MLTRIIDSLAAAIGTFISWIPEIVGFILVILLSYFLAWLAKVIVTGILRGVHLNRRLSDAPYGQAIQRLAKDPSVWLGYLAYWVAFLFGLTLAVLSLKVQVLSQSIHAIYGYLPNLLAAFLILIAAIIIAGGAHAIISKLMGKSITGQIASTIFPSIVMTIAVFMILVQLKIATSIVVITYIALVGSLAVAFAIAFGWGGIESARKLLDLAYRKGEENSEQIKKDFGSTGKTQK